MFANIPADHAVAGLSPATSPTRLSGNPHFSLTWQRVYGLRDVAGLQQDRITGQAVQAAATARICLIRLAVA